MAVDICIKIGGEAGQGMQTIGFTLAKVFTRDGLHIFGTQDYMSRIRGGHNFFAVRVKNNPVTAASEAVEILIALDKPTIEIHKSEVTKEGVIIYDGEQIKTDLSADIFLNVPLQKIAEEKGGNKLFLNTVAVGAALGILDYDLSLLDEVLKETFSDKGENVVQANIICAKAGYDYARENSKNHRRLELKSIRQKNRMLINGAEAIGLGALVAGCKFMSAYPMTPSTPITTFLAERAKEYDLVVEQAEDEIAAINMALGASFAGVRALTATSGGGFCLMVEGLGLAAATETPIVIIEAQRPGPSTGLPTRTEQGDLEFVLYASQGEFPRAILAPGNLEEAFYLTIKAFDLAEKYQIPVFIMTDQYLNDSYVDLEMFDLSKVKIERYLISDDELKSQGEYLRYKITESGISPRAFPSQAGKTVIADSDEHTEDGHLTEDLDIRIKIHDKRLRKMKLLSQDISPPKIYGPADAEIMFIGWGSALGPIKEAVEILNAQGSRVNLMHLSEIWPLPKDAIANFMGRARITIDVENNATGQLAHIIKAETGKSVTHKILKYDGRPFTPAHIIREFKNLVK